MNKTTSDGLSILKLHITTHSYRAVVVALLAELALLIPEVHGSNPLNGKIFRKNIMTVSC